MNTSPRHQLIGILCAVLLIAVTAQADIVNGDFENAGSDWIPVAPPGWSIDFPPAGGNPDGYAIIRSPFNNPGGMACIEQTFMCGEPGQGTGCIIGFEFRLTPIDAAPGSARIKVIIDGVEDVVVVGETDWDSVAYVVPCGEHTIQLCLEVDPQNNAWEASFDNVRTVCDGVVSNEHESWSSIKGRF